MSESTLTLISHPLCPYVQRAAIALTEKSVPFRRVDVDLADKPAWFLACSPLGKTPVLRVGGESIFESNVIVEYLEDTQPRPLHPREPLERARHRAWIEFSSAVLNDIGKLYSAVHAAAFATCAAALARRFGQLEAVLGDGPYFAGDRFSLVDAAFGPVFRYFDVFDTIGDFGVLADTPAVAAWRAALARRPSVRDAVQPDYAARLRDFLARRDAHIARLVAERGALTA